MEFVVIMKFDAGRAGIRQSIRGGAGRWGWWRVECDILAVRLG
jgi:hypothetical protein